MNVSPTPPPPSPGARQYEGLGGWLVLVPIGLILTLIRAGNSFRVFLLPLFHNWAQAMAPDDPGYDPHFKHFIMLEAFAVMLEVSFAVLLLFLFFHKKRLFPVLMIVHLATSVILSWTGLFMLSPITLPGVNVVMQMLPYITLARCIWIHYMVVSKRVKATFTR